MLWFTLRQLKSKQAPTRRRAAESLLEQVDTGAFKGLAEALAHDDDPEVRRLAAIALSKSENERRVDVLIAALRDRNAEVLKVVLTGFKHVADERLQPALLPLLHHTDPGVRGGAANLLNALGWRPVERTDEISFLIARGQILKAAAHGAAAIPALESVIQHGAYNQRIAAVEALGKIDDQRAVKPLLAALKSGDPSVCTAAITALGQVGGPQVFEPILPLLRHADGHVRTVTVEALARVGGGRAVEMLKPMLRDPVWDVRRAVASALGKSKDPRAVEALTGALQDADADVREAIAIALGSLNDRRAIGPLIKALTDPTTGVRRIAAAALSRIDEDWSASPEAHAAVNELKGALQDKDPDVRFAVGQLLESLGVDTPEAEVLVPKDTPSPSPEKRRRLAVSLLLATLCDVDRTLRQAAAESLGRLGDPRAEPALQRTLRDPDVGVRVAAENALLALQETKENA